MKKMDNNPENPNEGGNQPPVPTPPETPSINPEDLEMAQMMSLGRRGQYECTSEENLEALQSQVFQDGNFSTRQKDYLDLFVYDLSPKKLRKLLIEFQRRKNHLQVVRPRATHEEIYNEVLGGSDYQIYLQTQVRNYLDEAIANQADFSEAQKNLILEQGQAYYGVVVKDLLGTLEQLTFTWYGGQKTIQQKTLEDLEEDYLVTYLMFRTQRKFYVNEYFKAKTAEVIKTSDGNKLTKVINNEVVDVSVSQEEARITFFSDLYKMYHLQMQQGGRSPLAEYFQQTHGVITALDERIASPIEFHSGKRAYMEIPYPQGKERISDTSGMFSLKDITTTFFSVTERLTQFHQESQNFIKAINSGNLENVISAADNLDNDQFDLVLNNAPEIRRAMEIYMRIFRQYLANNGNVLSEDFLLKTASGANRIDVEAVIALSTAYKMSEQEAEFYLGIGKALAFTSGNLLLTLANSLPNLFTTIEKEQDPEISKKIADGTLTIRDSLLMSRVLKRLPLDFPFRSFLTETNRLRWLTAWTVTEPYQMDMNVWAPIKPGEPLAPAYERLRAANHIRDAMYFGCDDESVKYLQRGIFIPALHFNRVLNTTSLTARAGWRDLMLSRSKHIFIDGSRRAIDDRNTITNVDLAVDLILEKHGAWAAWEFVSNPPKDFLNIPDIDKKVMLEKILKYCYRHHPSLYSIIEERCFFRREELSFKENILEYLLNNLRAENNQRLAIENEITRLRTNGASEEQIRHKEEELENIEFYSLFLGADEKTQLDGSEPLILNATPSGLGDKNAADFARAKLVNKRLFLALQTVESAAIEHQVDLEDFFNNPDLPQHEHLKQRLFTELGVKLGFNKLSIKSEYKHLMQYPENWREKFSQWCPERIPLIERAVQANPANLANIIRKEVQDLWAKQLGKVFIKFVREIYYSDNSIFHNRQYVANKEVPDSAAERKRILKEIIDEEGEFNKKYISQSEYLSLREEVRKLQEKLIKSTNQGEISQIKAEIRTKEKKLKARVLNDNEIHYLRQRLAERKAEAIRLAQENLFHCQNRKIDEVYRDLILDGLIQNPFDWMYIDNAAVNMQAAGLKASKRNMGDLKVALEAYKFPGQALDKTIALIGSSTNPQKVKQEQIVEGIVEFLKGAGKTFAPGSGISGLYGKENSLIFGGLLTLYMLNTFIGPLGADFPIGSSVLKSWASLFNEEDVNNQGTLSPNSREKIITGLTTGLNEEDQIVVRSEKNQEVEDLTEQEDKLGEFLKLVGLEKYFPKRKKKLSLKPDSQFGDLSLQGIRETIKIPQSYSYFHTLLLFSALFAMVMLGEGLSQFKEASK